MDGGPCPNGEGELSQKRGRDRREDDEVLVKKRGGEFLEKGLPGAPTITTRNRSWQWESRKEKGDEKGVQSSFYFLGTFLLAKTWGLGGFPPGLGLERRPGLC